MPIRKRLLALTKTGGVKERCYGSKSLMMSINTMQVQLQRWSLQRKFVIKITTFSVSRYVLSTASTAIQKLDNTRPLSEVAELIRAQLLREEGGSGGTAFLEAGVRDLSPEGFCDHTGKKTGTVWPGKGQG